MKLYYSFYSIKNSNMNGSYLVKAPSKKEANSIVKQINPTEYTRIKSFQLKNSSDISIDIIDGCYATDLLSQQEVDKFIRSTKKYKFLECGS